MSYYWTCLNCFHYGCFIKREVFIMKEKWLFYPKVDIPLTGRDIWVSNWGRTERKGISLNQLIHILLIEGLLFLLIMPLPSFTVLDFHIFIPTVLLAMCCLFWVSWLCLHSQWLLLYVRQCCYIGWGPVFASIFNITLVLLLMVLLITKI